MPRRSDPLRSAAAALAALAAALGALVAIDSGIGADGWVDRLDGLARGWSGGPAFEAVYALSGVEFTGPLVALALGGFLWRRLWREAGVLALGAGGVLVIVDLLLKPAFARGRPSEGAPDLAGFAFPSGHAAGAVAFYGLLAVLASRLRPALRGPIFLAAGTWVAAVWSAAVAVRAHYPSDVLAGAAVGAAWLLVCLQVDRAAAGWTRPPAALPRPRAGG